MDRIATHDGHVVAVKRGLVDVQIVATSACAACAAHTKCGFADSKNKTVSVPSADWQQYHPGDAVRVCIDQSRGMLAVWIAYVLPAIVMLGIIAGLSAAHVDEGLVALAALAVLAVYVLVLYLVRQRIEKRFTLTVEKTVVSD